MNEDKTMTDTPAEALLDWITNSSTPMSMFRETDGDWVVVDTQSGTVIGSGSTAKDALTRAYVLLQSPAEAATGGGYSQHAG